MASRLTMKSSPPIQLVEDEESPRKQRIMLGSETMGTITLKNAIELNTTILDDVLDEEMEVLYPTFRQLQAKNAYYLDEIIIHEEKRGRGIGQDVMTMLFREERPILLYSLSEAVSFWEKLNFENICGYYYVWNPLKEA